MMLEIQEEWILKRSAKKQRDKLPEIGGGVVPIQIYSHPGRKKRHSRAYRRERIAIGLAVLIVALLLGGIVLWRRGYLF